MATAAQGHPESESATNLPPNQALCISSQTLPPSILSLSPNPAHSPSEQPAKLSDMTLLSSISWTEQAEGLLPPFSTRPYSQLPTPQSPNNIARYVGDLPQTPQSPVLIISQPAGPSTTSSSYPRLAGQKQSADDTPTKARGSKQCITPESSPSYGSRMTPPLRISLSTTPSFRTNHDSPKAAHSSQALELSAPIASPLAPSPHISSPISATSEHSSRLSSPFIAKLSMTDRSSKKKQARSLTASPPPMEIDNVFSSPSSTTPSRLTHKDTMIVSTLPVSPSQTSTSNAPAAGGEIERIRQALIEDHLAQIREAETRRPEYLRRSKRPLSDVEQTMFTDERDRERGHLVGITASPNKGRRLKLFQETSEESFEESLMAGGYGRYRTNDWVRQPQPLSVFGSNTSGTANVVEILEHVEEAPLTDKELKKRRRLEAFRSSAADSKPRSRLHPVDLVGKGRVLLDIPNEEWLATCNSPEATPSKKRGGGKRKKKSAEAAGGKDEALPQLVEEPEGPNWPDSEFPWRLRKEERSEEEKAIEEERLKWIERFLDRDTDDEEGGEDDPKSAGADDEDEEILPSAKWGLVYEDETDKPVPVRMGRGKMVPLLAHPEDPRRANAKKKKVFPSDPADARAALLAKKSVRALAYRNQRKWREVEAETDLEAVICICNGKDDGRELVQCDGCQTWYHLDCIGIRNIAELGREDDPWYCRSCVTRIRSPSPAGDPLPAILREPTFAPTDDAPRVRRTHDPTLYQPLHNSPLWNPPRAPKTPTRGAGRYSEPDALSSSDSSKFPSTPQAFSHDIRLYNTPGPFEYRPSSTNDDLPFDPNLTPSRGIKFGVPFTTPKSNPWSIRAGGLFHTPQRHYSRSSFGRSFGSLEEMGGSLSTSDGLTRYHNLEDSPVGRNAGDNIKPRKILESPLLPRATLPPRPGPDESPVVRFRPQYDGGKHPNVAGTMVRDDSAYMR